MTCTNNPSKQNDEVLKDFIVVNEIETDFFVLDKQIKASSSAMLDNAINNIDASEAY